MGSIGPSQNASKFILTAEALNKALPKMHVSTRAIHADDFISSHRAIAPGMHTAVNFRYARDPEDLVPEENEDASTLKLTSDFHMTSSD
jgi:cystathionine gamma-synthase